MKTVDQLLLEVRKGGKTCSRPQLYRYFALFKIAPFPVRQRPRLYPDDAAARILTGLGLAQPGGEVVSLAELGNERAKARAARGNGGSK